MITCLREAAEISLGTVESTEHDADFQVLINGETWSCYTVAISNRDLLLYCDKGTATYLVDIYDNRYVINLHDLEVSE